MGQYFVSFTYVMAAKVKTSEALDRSHFSCDEQHFCLFDKETQFLLAPSYGSHTNAI